MVSVELICRGQGTQPTKLVEGPSMVSSALKEIIAARGDGVGACFGERVAGMWRHVDVTAPKTLSDLWPRVGPCPPSHGSPKAGATDRPSLNSEHQPQAWGREVPLRACMDERLP